MAKLKQSIDANVTAKYLYHGYLLNKIRRQFGVTNEAIHADVDLSKDILVFPALSNEFGFNEQIYNVHIDRKNLNLAMFLNPKLFAKSTIFDTFLAGECLVEPKHFSRYVCVFHIGGMILAMYRADDVDTNAGIAIDHPDEGRFVITTIDEFLGTRYAPIPVD